MSLGENILKLRKQKGLSQEELGDKIKVTRQTISNWELNETSPNPEQLKLLSKELKVSIDELLDNNIKSISNKSRKSFNILKLLIIVIITIFLIFVLLVVTKIIVKNIRNNGREIEESIECSIYDEEHSYSITYYELTGEPIASGGDSYFYDILDLDKYNDAHQIFNIINDYVKKNGGTCKMVNNNEMNDLISMEIKEGTLTKTGATVIIKGNVYYDIMTGESFWIEKYNNKNNSWEKLESICDNCAFNLIGYNINAQKPLVLEQNWERLYGNLSKGEYRLVKDAFMNSETPINEDDIFYIWVEFSID